MRIQTLVALSLSLAACATSTPEDETGAAEDTAAIDQPMEDLSCTDASVLCVSLLVPDSYEGSPRNLFVGLYESLPPAGPPTIFLMDEDAPEIIPGKAISLALQEDVPDSGEYYIYSVLYDQTGGEWMPVPGIDYVATSDEPYAFEGQGLDVGEVALKLYQGEW